ncbi:MAG: protein kinase family protein [Solidesulfovibrio sp.]
MAKKYPDVINFIRQQDYKFVKELGQGACGKTILLHDSLIDEYFVCKKYSPVSGDYSEELYINFIREIKLLCQVYHKNVVRIYNYHLFPDHCTGYILMEYVDGQNVEDFANSHPEQLNELFVQVVDGFRYLESNNILHRDIRPHNIIVRRDGTVKIIDLGFGKQVKVPEDFDKSISLNWWCNPPLEFQVDTYDFKTEVYFVGKLFERMVAKREIDYFKYNDILSRMCQHDPARRIDGFVGVDKVLAGDKFIEIELKSMSLKPTRNFRVH